MGPGSFKLGNAGCTMLHHVVHNHFIGRSCVRTVGYTMFRAGELENDMNSKIIITIGIVNSCIESIGSEDLIVGG